MFHPHAYSKCLRLHNNALFFKLYKRISCTMSCGKYHGLTRHLRNSARLFIFHATNAVPLQEKPYKTRVKMHRCAQR